MSGESSGFRSKTNSNGMLGDESESNQEPRRGDPRMSTSSVRAVLSGHWRGEFMEQSLMQAASGRKIESKTESVFPRGLSPVQSFRSSGRNVTTNIPTRFSSGSEYGYEEAEQGETMEEEGTLSADLWQG